MSCASMSCAAYHRDLPAIIVLLGSVAIGLLDVLNGQGMNIGVKVITGAGSRRRICKVAGQTMFGGEMKVLLMVIGIIVLTTGLPFLGQGLGYIQWPASSFMVNQIKWVYYGGGIAVVGILLITIASL
jgi:hypothetical protein